MITYNIVERRVKSNNKHHSIAKFSFFADSTGLINY